MKNSFEKFCELSLQYSSDIVKSAAESESFQQHFPAPPIELQVLIKEIRLLEFPKNMKSTLTYQELNEYRFSMEKLIKDLEKYDDITKVSIVMVFCTQHLTGQFHTKIDMILNVLASKIDREEMIWKNNTQI